MDSLNLVELFNYFLPPEYSQLDMGNDIKRIYIVPNKSRLRVIDELKIHAESLQTKNIDPDTIEVLISKLSIAECDQINILCGSTTKYVFEMLISDDLSRLIGSLIDKKRVKSLEEIMFEKSLGIDHS